MGLILSLGRETPMANRTNHHIQAENKVSITERRASTSEKMGLKVFFVSLIKLYLTSGDMKQNCLVLSWPSCLLDMKRLRTDTIASQVCCSEHVIVCDRTVQV